jgi:hypothetical protein
VTLNIFQNRRLSFITHLDGEQRSEKALVLRSYLQLSMLERKTKWFNMTTVQNRWYTTGMTQAAARTLPLCAVAQFSDEFK